MPKGVTRTIETKIAEIETKKAEYKSKIEDYKAKIASLDKKIVELKDTQKQKDLENLLEVIKASGKTPEEVIASLK
jgi:septal ring factor EnvC (AmiA/AmiB activator)